MGDAVRRQKRASVPSAHDDCHNQEFLWQPKDGPSAPLPLPQLAMPSSGACQ